MLVFLEAAAYGCSADGCVLAVLPGLGTRPGIEQERRSVLKASGALGLALERIVEQSVSYETPLFEQNAFRAAGLCGDLRFWRRGDLFVFRRTSACLPPRRPTASTSDPWQEVHVGTMRVRLGVDVESRGATPSIPLLNRHILPTVSRRDP